jgi:hypothetical protein
MPEGTGKYKRQLQSWLDCAWPLHHGTCAFPPFRDVSRNEEALFISFLMRPRALGNSESSSSSPPALPVDDRTGVDLLTSLVRAELELTRLDPALVLPPAALVAYNQHSKRELVMQGSYYKNHHESSRTQATPNCDPLTVRAPPRGGALDNDERLTARHCIRVWSTLGLRTQLNQKRVLKHCSLGLHRVTIPDVLLT